MIDGLFMGIQTVIHPIIFCYGFTRCIIRAYLWDDSWA